MSCLLAQSYSLPPIVGEDEGKKFTVSVTLSTASKFLSYDPKSRTFELKSRLGYFKHDAHIVKIEVKN